MLLYSASAKDRATVFCLVDFHDIIESLSLIQNRVTAHSATLDWKNGQRRHLARITPQAERPYETPFVEPKQEEIGNVENGKILTGA